MKVILHKLFPYAPYLNEYIGFEMDIPDDGDPIAEVETLRKLAEKSHRERYPHIYEENQSNQLPQGVSMNEQPKERTVSVSMEDAINSCTDMTVLSTYKLLVKGKPYLQDIFDKKVIELSK